MVDNCETVTSLTFNTITNNLEYTDENGVTNNISLIDLVSVVTDNNANTSVQTIATHTSGDGTVTAIEETVTTLVDNGNDTYTYTSEDGSTTTFNSADETLTTIALNGNNTSFDYVDEDGVTTNIDICNMVDNCETVTSLTFNTTTNNLEYTDEDGVTNNVNLGDLISVVTDNNANTSVQTIATHTSGDGTVTAIEETVTTLVDNGDNDTYTYTSENGTTTIIDHKEIFYPPSVPIDASVTGTFQIDLHANYISQYGTPAFASPGAPAAVKTFAANDLYYYVLDYDNSVINVTGLSATGVLDYQIVSVPTNNCTYINIVFVEK
jgi:hypothetical protein